MTAFLQERTRHQKASRSTDGKKVVQSEMHTSSSGGIESLVESVKRKTQIAAFEGKRGNKRRKV